MLYKFLFSLIVMISFSTRAVECDLSGGWEFYKVHFEGKYRPPFSTTLKLFMELGKLGESRIYYYRENQEGFCERKGDYRIESGYFIDTVTWVNPGNEVQCALDPDMQLGNQTTTRIEKKGDDLYMHLSLSGEPLIYIWRPIKNVPTP